MRLRPRLGRGEQSSERGGADIAETQTSLPFDTVLGGECPDHVAALF